MQQENQNNQYRSIVVPYRPGRRALIIALLIAITLVFGTSTYFFGVQSSQLNFTELEDERDHLAALLKETEGSLALFRQQLANAKVGSEVDRVAVEDIRGVLKEQNETIAELKEEISFYKGLMAPSEREKGLSIRSWDVFADDEVNNFRFKLTVQQLALKHVLLSGYLNIDIVGTESSEATPVGQEKRYSLHLLSDEIPEKNIRMRFKYFQTIEGALKLPENFEPERMELIARASKPKWVEIKKNYDWTVR